MWLIRFLLLTPVLLGAQQWTPQLEVAGRTGGFARGGGAAGLVPVYQWSNSLAFFQGGGGRWLDNWGGNLGAGYRAMRGRLAYGVNGFLDYSWTDRHRSFWQAGLGAELFAPCFQARINAYIPFNRRQTVARRGALFLQGVDLWRQNLNLVERSYSGFDVEAGYAWSWGCNALWGHAAYYDYTTPGNRDIRGPRLRLSYQRDRLLGKLGVWGSVGLVWQYDAVHRGKLAAELSIQVPLGRPGSAACCGLTSVRRRLGFPVRRTSGIFVRRGDRPELASIFPVINPDGLQQRVFFTTATGAGVGTQTDPTNAAGALALSRPYDFIIPLADAGPLPLASSFVLKNNQQLLGFGDSTSLTLSVNDASLTLFNGAGRPTLTGGAFPVVTVNQQNRVQGLSLTAGTDGINGANPVGTVVSDVDITAVTDDGIMLVNATQTLLEDVSIATTGDFGIQFGTAAFDTTLRRVSVSGTPDDGIVITNGTNTLLESVSVTAAGDFGINISTSVNSTLRGVTVAGTTDDAILFVDASNTLLEDITLTTVGDFGINFAGSATDTIIRRATITGTTDDGILMADASNTLIEDTTLTGIGDFGIQIAGSARDTTIRRVTIDTAADDGIIIFDGSNTTIEQSSISNITGGPGIFLVGSSRQLSVIGTTISTVTGDGIMADDSSNTTIVNVSISDTGGAGIFLDDSSSHSLIQNVRIDDTNGDGILCQNCFDLRVENAELTNIGNGGGDFGISLTNARDVVLTTNRIDTVTDDGINVAVGNNLQILDTTINNAVSRGIDLNNVTGNVRIQGNTITDITGGGNFGIECTNSTTEDDAFYQISNNTILGNGTAGGFTTTDTGISFVSTGAARVCASVAGNELRGLDGSAVQAFKATASAAPGLLDVSITHNHITDLDALPAINVQAQASSDNASVDFTVAGNTIDDVNGLGMLFRHDATVGGTVAPVIMSGEVNNNTVTQTGGLFAETDMEDNPGHSFTLCLDGNAFVETTAQAVRVNADTSSFGTVNVTACGNTDNGSPSGLFAYEFDAEGGFTGAWCLTARDNNSDRTPPAIQIENDAAGATFEVTDLANLSAINNDIGVDTSASSAPIVDRATPCPGCACNLP